MTMMSKTVRNRRSVLMGAGVLVVLGALVLAACYPGEITSIQQLDVAITQWDTTYTWSKPDTVVGIYDSIVIVGDTTGDTLADVMDSTINARVKAGFEGYGYTTRIVPTSADSTWIDSVDYLVTTSVLRTTNVSVTSYPYNPWYPCWSCWPPTRVDTWESGTLFLDMFNDVPPTDSTAPPIVWEGVINGPLSTNTAANVQRLNDLITQVFAQSPYLQPK